MFDCGHFQCTMIQLISNRIAPKKISCVFSLLHFMLIACVWSSFCKHHGKAFNLIVLTCCLHFMIQEVSVEHHHLLCPGSEPMPLKPFSVDAVKGWTRASCVAFIALAVSELDLSDAGNLEKLKPITKVLDRSWMLPMHVSWCSHLQPCFLQAFLTDWQQSNW